MQSIHSKVLDQVLSFILCEYKYLSSEHINEKSLQVTDIKWNPYLLGEIFSGHGLESNSGVIEVNKIFIVDFMWTS